MSHVMLADDDGVDRGERLSPDDMATRREEQFLAAALRAQAARTAAARGVPGTCLNCGARCAEGVVYCDADCRADDEARRLRAQRLGRA